MRPSVGRSCCKRGDKLSLRSSSQSRSVGPRFWKFGRGRPIAASCTMWSRTVWAVVVVRCSSIHVLIVSTWLCRFSVCGSVDERQEVARRDRPTPLTFAVVCICSQRFLSSLVHPQSAGDRAVGVTVCDTLLPMAKESPQVHQQRSSTDRTV